MLQHDSKIRSLSARVIPADWEANNIDTGDLPSATTLPSPPARQTSSSSQRETLRRSCFPVIGSQRRASVVASPPECLEWPCDFEPFPTTLHRNGCFEDELGCCMPVDNNGGLWSQMEKKLHINCLELIAGTFAVKSFKKGRLCAHVRLRMDNTSAVAYVNKLGGTHSLILSNLAVTLWEWALSRGMILSAEHLPGSLNITADWEIPSCQGHKQLAIVPSYVSLANADTRSLRDGSICRQVEHPTSSALASDTLQQDWSTKRNYAFPPFCLIMRSLAKLREKGGELIMITPVWPTQVWY